MSTDKPFRRIGDLVAALAQVEQRLSSGDVQREQLEAACADAQELFERLIVLRHKAREASLTGSPTPGTASAPRMRTEHGAAKEAEPAQPPNAERPLRLDTRPAPDTSSRQTSLIEAIAHTESKLAEADEGKGPKGAPNVATQLERAPVTDLGRSISLSHKFWFVAELFNGDRIAYDKGIEKLNAMNGRAEAEAFVRTEVIARLKKPADPEALTTFTDLVQRRYV